MAHFLRTVNRNMCASRRNTPVPLDFQTALAEHNLTLRSLLPHLDPPVYSSPPRSSSPLSASPKTKRHPVLSSRSQILPPLYSQPASSSTTTYFTPFGFSNSVSGESSETTASKQEATLQAILNGGSSGREMPNGTGAEHRSQQQQKALPTNIPAGFPALPSQHTYRSRPVFTTREKDPQRIREQATDEGRLGEEALRRLAAKQAELRRVREEQQKKEIKQQQTGSGDGLSRVISASAPDMTRSASTSTSTRKRKAERDEAAAAAASSVAAGSNITPSAVLDTIPKFRSQADEMFRSLMSSLGGGGGGGEEAGAEGIISTTDGDREWNGGLNEPINSERIYWRQTPRRSAAGGG